MTNMKLLKDHSHAGLPYKEGDTIEVDAPTSEWLITNGIASKDGSGKPLNKVEASPETKAETRVETRVETTRVKTAETEPRAEDFRPDKNKKF